MALAAALVCTVICNPSSAAAEAWADCRQESGDRAIAACTIVLNRTLESDANRMIAFTKRGDAHAAKGDYDLAIADYDQAMALNKVDRVVDVNALVLHHRGLALHAKGDYDRAIADFFQAIQVYATKLGRFTCGGWGMGWQSSNREETSTRLRGYADACLRQLETTHSDRP